MSDCAIFTRESYQNKIHTSCQKMHTITMLIAQCYLLSIQMAGSFVSSYQTQLSEITLDTAIHMNPKMHLKIQSKWRKFVQKNGQFTTFYPLGRSKITIIFSQSCLIPTYFSWA